MTYGIDSGARCAVVGYGSWATALVKILLENEAEVGWYIRSRDVLEHIRRHGTNPRYLSGVHFPAGRLFLSDDLDAVVRGADIIVLAVPSVYLKTTLDALTEPLEGKFVVSAIKGIVPGELVTVAEYVNRRYGVPFDRIGIVSGPCHAEEVALERLSYLTAVCKNMDDSVMLGRKIRTPYIAVSHSTDIYGIEYASVLKNIYALAVGVAVGLGYGDNFLAVLISNGAMEMSRFMERTYPAPRDTFASAYLGDLLVTSYSQFSRNRRFGLMIGKGYSVASARAEMNMVAEGYYAAECVMKINERHGVEMPIASAVYDMLYREAPAASALASLTDKLV
ncbi:NAD(P)H-dependent glycerol-3-phosphate dehydrogenase [uncultured Alistipes sp.]|uniref:NAD(P)H-dependent glycerol-3-phosphate dehydrogenase n=1 Tax=uncultured Alistipes sp. TaxID=538949 RepID=UPI00262EDC0C|nr:NAD(P)H-dependent glycerol-3-phosphate dehydrogenase [uncultured Alistipes sp.]